MKATKAQIKQLKEAYEKAVHDYDWASETGDPGRKELVDLYKIEHAAYEKWCEARQSK